VISNDLAHESGWRPKRLAECVDMVARGKSCATGPDEPVRLPAPEIGDGK